MKELCNRLGVVVPTYTSASPLLHSLHTNLKSDININISISQDFSTRVLKDDGNSDKTNENGSQTLAKRETADSELKEDSFKNKRKCVSEDVPLPVKKETKVG